jgi:hypothetical protein
MVRIMNTSLRNNLTNETRAAQSNDQVFLVIGSDCVGLGYVNALSGLGSGGLRAGRPRGLGSGVGIEIRVRKSWDQNKEKMRGKLCNLS